MSAKFVIKNKTFLKMLGNLWIILKACNAAFPIFSRTPSNGSFWKCNKIGMLFLPNMNDIMLVYWYKMVYSSKSFFCFSSQIHEHLSWKYSGKKQDLPTKQEPEGAYNVQPGIYYPRIFIPWVKKSQ